MTRIDRRALLRGLGGALISLPALEACGRLDGVGVPTRVVAPETQTSRAGLVSTPARRLITLMRPDGCEPALWFPSSAGGGERDFVLAAQTAALAPVREHLILTRGIHNKVAMDAAAGGRGNGHIEGVSSLFTGWAAYEDPVGTNSWHALGGPSIDQAVSALHQAQGYRGRARGLYFGDEGLSGYSGISVRADGSNEDQFWDVRILFDGPPTQTEQALQQARLTRRSVLDGARADFTALSQKVSGEDRRRVEAHLEALRSIEERLQATPPRCTAPMMIEPANADQRRDLYHDVLVAAFACDATRVGALAFYHSGGGGPQLPFIDVLEDIHELSHQVVSTPPDHASHAAFTRYIDWYNGKTVSLVEKLKAVRTPSGGTLFDDTVIVQGSEIGFDHSGPNLPLVILAGAATPLRTGRFVDLFPAAMHTHLLTTVLHAFGVPARRVGDPQYPAGDLDHLFLRSA